MSRVMKRQIIIALALLMVLALPGCSGKSGDLAEKMSDAFGELGDQVSSLGDQLSDIGDRLDGGQKVQEHEEQEPEAKDTPVPTEELEETPADTESSDNIRPEVKEAIDACEEYFNKYADFMESYDESDLGSMAEYLSLMGKYDEMTQELDDIEDMELTDAEMIYYTQALLRIDQRLLEVSG